MLRVRQHVSNVPTRKWPTLFDGNVFSAADSHAKTQRHALVRSKYGIAFWRLSRHPCRHDRFLRRYPKIPRRLQGAPDIRIFRAAIENNQSHTVRALHLIAVAESLRPLAERLAAFGTEDFYPVGHEILAQADYQAVF
jgi:hypothetical protein